MSDCVGQKLGDYRMSLASPLVSSSLSGAEKSAPTSSEDSAALLQLSADPAGRISSGEGTIPAQSRISPLSIDVELRESASHISSQESGAQPYTPAAAFSLGKFVSGASYAQKGVAAPLQTQAAELPPKGALATTILPAAGVKPRHRRARVIALLGLLVTCLITLMGIINRTYYIQDKKAVYSTQQVTVPGVTHASGAENAQKTPIATAAATVGQTGILPTAQVTSTAPTQPVVVPTAPTTTPTTPDPTAIPALAVAITSAPTSAPSGSNAIILTKANRGGVTIVLNGKKHALAQQTANSQGVAVFQIRITGKASTLTAIATDQNGNEASSAPWTITIT